MSFKKENQIYCQIQNKYFNIIMSCFCLLSGPRCTEPRDEGKGKEKLLKYFYDPRSQGCVPFFYKGEGGSSNRFSSDRACVKACSPKVCSLPKDEGACFAAIPMYYYDTEEKMCLMFLYRGCNGNANRFDSREDCHNMCAGQFNKSHTLRKKGTMLSLLRYPKVQKLY
uniref:BPTI/Kunitz domain-containing protein-like n=1 Tax=Sinocyclocheilus anshuiensis TaxID=1608454 RepID=A0A671N2V3_9TELE